MDLKEFTKNPVTAGIVAVLAISVILSVMGTNVSGMVASDPISVDPINAHFPVPADVAEINSNWGECHGVTTGWAGADALCKNEGFVGAAPVGRQPCRYATEPTRWDWDGTFTEGMMTMGDQYEVGMAFVGVKCLAA
jgi:hypothetical protein